MTDHVPDLNIQTGIHVHPSAELDVTWWNTTGGGEPCPWRATLHLKSASGFREVTIFLNPADLDRLAEVLLAAQAEGRAHLAADAWTCETTGCGHTRSQHRPTPGFDDLSCTVPNCDCDEYRDEPPGAGADPYGRTADDMARSTE